MSQNNEQLAQALGKKLATAIAEGKFDYLDAESEDFANALAMMVLPDIAAAEENGCKQGVESKWLPIDSAPKKGEAIIIFNEKWDSMPVARFGEYPGNPVEDENGNPCLLRGWVIDDFLFTKGAEDGFLGWDVDIADGQMPTHWMPKPEGKSNV